MSRRTVLQITKLIWSSTGSRRSWSQLATKDCKTLAKTDNKEIGQKSDEIDLGGWIFGAGITTADFQISGTVPCLTEVLNIAVSGSAISGAKSLSIQLGRWSGHGAL